MAGIASESVAWASIWLCLRFLESSCNTLVSIGVSKSSSKKVETALTSRMALIRSTAMPVEMFAKPHIKTMLKQRPNWNLGRHCKVVGKW